MNANAVNESVSEWEKHACPDVLKSRSHIGIVTRAFPARIGQF